MTDFNWTDGPFEFVQSGKIYPNITFEHESKYGTTFIQNEAGESLGSVWTYNGDANKLPEFMGKTFVRKMTIVFLGTLTDKQLADHGSDLHTKLIEAYNELAKRGYKINSHEDFDLDVSPITRIYKIEQIEKDI